jgi:hypothetical protein
MGIDTLEPPEMGPNPEENKARPRYIIRTPADWLKPHESINYVVDKILTEGSLAVFYGEPGAKKTYSLLYMAACVAAGIPYLNFKTTQKKVLIIDEESGERRLSYRLSEILRGENLSIDIPMISISLAGFRLDDKNDAVILQALIEEYQAGFVVMDALADLMIGDENSKKDTLPVFTRLKLIADKTGATIPLIHHSNKAGGYRGSSAIKGAVDHFYKVESEDGDNIVKFTSEKNRDGDPQKWAAAATWLDAEGTFTMHPWTATKTEKKLSKSQRHVIEYLTEHGISAMPDITKSPSICSPEAARKAVYDLADMGIIRRTNPGEYISSYELIDCEM